MRRAVPVGIVVLLLLPAPALPRPARPAALPPEVARLAPNGPVETRLGPDAPFAPVQGPVGVRLGQQIRTGDTGLAAVSFPWMSVFLGPGSFLSIGPSPVLTTRLEAGRIEEDADRGMVKLQTAEAEIRGEGRVVVHRREGQTEVSVHRGSFRVSTGRRAVTVRTGEGTFVRTGSAPERPRALPSPPQALNPGSDPVYVRRDTPALLSWASNAPRHQLQVVSMDGSEIALQREVGAAPAEIQLGMLGTFRWRVGGLDGTGLEGLPAEGYLCVVEK